VMLHFARYFCARAEKAVLNCQEVNMCGETPVLLKDACVCIWPPNTAD